MYFSQSNCRSGLFINSAYLFIRSSWSAKSYICLSCSSCILVVNLMCSLRSPLPCSISNWTVSRASWLMLRSIGGRSDNLSFKFSYYSSVRGKHNSVLVRAISTNSRLRLFITSVNDWSRYYVLLVIIDCVSDCSAKFVPTLSIGSKLESSA